MSIKLLDGTEVPDLPQEDLDEYPYAYIFKGIDSETGSLLGTVALMCQLEGVYIPGELIGYACGIVYVPACLNVTRFWEPGMDTWEAGDLVYEDENEVPVGAVGTIIYEPGWVNYDILIVSGIDENFTPTVGTEVFLANCAAPKVFVLPDGTELPPLPEECFEGTPYGAVVKVNTDTYGLVVTSSPMVSSSAIHTPDLSDGRLYAQPGTTRTFASDGETWVGVEAPTLPNLAFTGLTVEDVAWTNYDILYIVYLNTSSGVYNIGLKAAHKSDENYRITGGFMKSLANRIRLLAQANVSVEPSLIEYLLRSIDETEVILL